MLPCRLDSCRGCFCLLHWCQQECRAAFAFVRDLETSTATCYKGGGSLKQCYILFMHTNVSLCSWVLAHKHTCTNLLMACPTPWMLRQLLYLQQQAELGSRYHPDGCGGWELLGNGVLMSCRLRMTLGALRMVAQYLSGAQNSSLPPMLGKGCAWRIFFHSFPPQSGIKSWHLMIMN